MMATTSCAPDQWLRLGAEKMAQGALRDAEKLWGQGLKEHPNHPGLHYNHGIVNQHLGELTKASQSLARAHLLRPQHGPTLGALGTIALAMGDGVQAQKYLQAARALSPQDSTILHNLALALMAQQKTDEAAKVFGEALSLDGLNPTMRAVITLGLVDALSRGDDGQCQRALGLLEEAAYDLQTLATAHSARHHLLLARLHQRAKRLGLAHEALTRAQPFYAGAVGGDISAPIRRQRLEWFFLRARTQQDSGNGKAALATYRQALMPFIQAHNPPCHAQMSTTVELAPLQELASAYLLALHTVSLDAAGGPQALLCYGSDLIQAADTSSDSWWRSEHRFLANYFWPGTAELGLRQDRSFSRKSGPLRIAYLGADFRRHSVAYFLHPLLRHHDRQRFWVHVYSDVAPAHRDLVSARLENVADVYHHCHGLEDGEVYELMRQDAIDLIVDCGGHTHSRLRFLATMDDIPIVGYCGYPDITGLATERARLVDAMTDPQRSAPNLPLAGHFLCYDHKLSLALADHDAQATGEEALWQKSTLPKGGHLRLISANSLSKLSDETINLWAQTLLALPTATLTLKANGLQDVAVQESVSKRFAALGVEPDRLTFLGFIRHHHRHLSVYRHHHFALDTFPYGGTTTTYEALMMGVPVLTLAGDAHVSRVGASILHSMALEDWVARSADEFVRRAQGHAMDLARLLALRAEIQAKLVLASDVASFMAGYEQTLETFMQRYFANALESILLVSTRRSETTRPIASAR